MLSHNIDTHSQFDLPGDLLVREY